MSVEIDRLKITNDRHILSSSKSHSRRSPNTAASVPNGDCCVGFLYLFAFFFIYLCFISDHQWPCDSFDGLASGRCIEVSTVAPFLLYTLEGFFLFLLLLLLPFFPPLPRAFAISLLFLSLSCASPIFIGSLS